MNSARYANNENISKGDPDNIFVYVHHRSNNKYIYINYFNNMYHEGPIHLFSTKKSYQYYTSHNTEYNSSRSENLMPDVGKPLFVYIRTNGKLIYKPYDPTYHNHVGKDIYVQSSDGRQFIYTGEKVPCILKTKHLSIIPEMLKNQVNVRYHS